MTRATAIIAIVASILMVFVVGWLIVGRTIERIDYCDRYYYGWNWVTLSCHYHPEEDHG
jgi:ABC-type transport system involved in cytochrome bd biosynthesis fused ATPase/permease subunit